MIKADTILAHATIVTMDENFLVVEDGSVVLIADSIVAVGPADQVALDYESSETIDCEGYVVLPGLINAHTHAPMTLLRGLADDLRLDVWLMGYMMPTEREFVDPEFVKIGTSIACAEMIRSGITTFCDMYYFEDSVAEATAEAGLRGILGQTVLKFPSPDAASYETSLQMCRDFIKKWLGHPLIIPAVSPHAPYTTTPEILAECAQIALEFNVPLHIHLSETALEVSDSRRQNGMPVIPWIKKHGVLGARVIAAHCVHVDEGEMRTLQDRGVGVAHNPTSNLKLASGIAPVTKMLELGLQVGIGTDGPASNNDLDMFEETRLAALIAKVATDDPTSVPAKTALAMATSMGARALHIGDIAGSIEAGKRADLIVLNLNTVHNLPHFRRNPDAIYSQIVYAAKAADVRDVICNGAWLMRNRELLTIDTDLLLQQASEIGLKIDQFLVAREEDILSRLLNIGELQQEESFEVQVKARIESAEQVHAILDHPDIQIVQTSHYRQHDSYFHFGAPSFERVRYREDDFLDDEGRTTNVRTRLTLTTAAKEQEIREAVLLSRSRYISPATRPLRFYREYFAGAGEFIVVKERKRWHIDYHGLRLYVNLDKLIEPSRDGFYLEIKSRTWSLKDAEHKADAIYDLINLLGVDRTALIKEEYVTLLF